MKTNPQVLIIGAGPTGLVLAIRLTQLGVEVRIVDKTVGPGTTSRALAVHARTLELYRQMGLTEAIIERGYNVPAIGLWARGRRKARISFGDAGREATAYPFLQIFPQDEHEKLLVDRLEALGIFVERETELLDYTESEGGVAARISRRGREEIVSALYIAGCDGAHSRVRQTMGTQFPGGTYQQLFYVADAEVAGPAINGDVAIDLDEADFLAVFPLAASRRVRLIGTVRDERAAQPESLRFEDVSTRAIEHLALKVEKVNWFSTYRVHHRVTAHFRKGRAFLSGDAAHIHSPAGGQGMNTGIGDAINLAWKLTMVLAGRAPDTLLDTYEAERIAFAQRLVKTTDRLFSAATASGKLASFVRTRFAPPAISVLMRLRSLREFGFRLVSQLLLNYRQGPLSAGRGGKISGGDRLPWIKIAGADNYAKLDGSSWRVHVYGEAQADLVTACAERSVALDTFPWQQEFLRAGVKKDAFYLVRPDTYVALAQFPPQPELLAKFLTDRRLQLAGERQP